MAVLWVLQYFHLYTDLTAEYSSTAKSLTTCGTKMIWVLIFGHGGLHSPLRKNIEKTGGDAIFEYSDPK